MESAGCSDVMEKRRARARWAKDGNERKRDAAGDGRGRSKGAYLQRYPITAGGINLPLRRISFRQGGNLKSIRSHPISIVGKVAWRIPRDASPPRVIAVKRIASGLDVDGHRTLKLEVALK